MLRIRHLKNYLESKMKIKFNNETINLVNGGVEQPKLDYITFGEIRPFYLNREEVESSTKKIKDSMNNNGRFRTFEVFGKSKDGYYDCVDTHHLYYASQELYESDDKVGVAIVWWVNPNDVWAKRKYVQMRNSNQVTWKLWDHVLERHKALGGDYTFLHDEVVKYKKVMSIGSVVAAYTGYTRNNQDCDLKRDKLTISSQMKIYGDLMLERVKVSIQKINKGALGGGRLRYLLPQFLRTALKTNNQQKFVKFFDRAWEDVVLLADNGVLEDNNAHLNGKYKELVKQYL